MNRYDSYNPNIPYNIETPKEENLPPFDKQKEEISVAEPKGKSKNPKTKIREKGKKKKNNEISFFKSIYNFFGSETSRWIFGLFLGFLAVYIGIAFFSYFSSCLSDQSEINNSAIGSAGEIANAAGEGGARISEFLINECFGLGSIVIVVWLLWMSLKQLVGRPRFKTVNFTIKCLVALITVSLIIGLLTIGLNSHVNWGGYHGRYINEFIIHFLGWSGAVILCLFMVGCFVLICMRDVVKWIIKKKKIHDEKRRVREEKRKERLAREREIEEMRRFEDNEGVSPYLKDNQNLEKIAQDTALNFGGEDNLYYQNLPEFDEVEYSLDEKDENTSSEGDYYVMSHPLFQDTKEGVSDSLTNETGGENNETNPDASDKDETLKSDKNEKIENGDNESDGLDMIVNVNSISQVNEKRFDSSNNNSSSLVNYKFPPFNLLREGATKVDVDAEEQLANKEKIRSTLLDFDIPITSIEATIGPTVTLYEIVPDKGVKVAKIRSLVDDIALSLSAEGVRIIAPIPGKGAVGIEVANKHPQTVSMRTILKSPTFMETKYKLPIAMGSTISNDVYIADLAKMPHLLVAGATGQGKSVGLNAIIASLLYSKRPDELKFVMIDPKMVEFSLYAKIESHYLAKIPDAQDAIITDMDKVVATLSSLCIEMDNRYQLLKEAHTRNIVEYNEKIKEKKLNPMEGHRFLPYIVVIVDEFSDLIMTAGKEVEIPIARLAQKARAVGMHVIIATQRPSTNVITGIIKANFPARIAFKVSSGVDSKTILDTPGAQQLIGRGDMLISNSAPMVRVQCAFIDTPEVEEICDYISRQPYAQGAYELPEPSVGNPVESDSERGNNFGEKDELFDEVARLIVTTNTASTSSLQRRYSIGYNRAGKIMDQLEAAGIVGPAQGGKPRSVLVDAITLESILNP